MYRVSFNFLQVILYERMIWWAFNADINFDIVTSQIFLKIIHSHCEILKKVFCFTVIILCSRHVDHEPAFVGFNLNSKKF
jgi:hypothetical protein